MMLSRAEQNVLWERASNLAERFSGVFLPAGNDEVSGLRYLSQWQEKSGVGQNGQLGEMITTMTGNSVPSDHLAGLLGPVRMAFGSTLPSWINTVSEIVIKVAFAFASGSKEQAIFPAVLRGSRQIPFQSLYEPIATLAQAHVQTAFPDAGLLLGVSAWQGLRAQLMERISVVASRPLQTMFQTQIALENTGLSGWFAQQHRAQDDADPTARKSYARFVENQGEDGLRPFISSYPVAARLVSRVVLDWIESVIEFLQRFQGDREKLSKQFHDGRTLLRISSIKGGISDPHNGGRTVLILRFQGGKQIVYKPRPLKIDTLFFDLIGALNRRVIFPLPQALAALDCGQYGWVSHVSVAPCQNRSQAERFYYRSGGLMCLVHWLRGIDCHSENFMAVGEQPVLVDLECLGHPFRPMEASPGDSNALAQISNSALRTGFLPLLQNPDEGAPHYDNSALGAPLSRLSLYPIPWWQKVNLDQMGWVYARRPLTRKQHRPRLLHRTLDARDFSASILTGYEQMAECLRGSHADEFARHRQRMGNCARRFIKRPTVIYAALMLKTLDPKYLRSGVTRSIELQALSCDPGDETDWASEIASLEKLDVPYFRIDGRTRKLPMPAAPPLTGHACAAEMLLIQMSLDRQLMAVEGNVYAKKLRES